MAAAAPSSSDPQEGQAMAKADAEAAEASNRSLVPIEVEKCLFRAPLLSLGKLTFYYFYFYIYMYNRCVGERNKT